MYHLDPPAEWTSNNVGSDCIRGALGIGGGAIRVCYAYRRPTASLRWCSRCVSPLLRAFEAVSSRSQ